MKRWYVVQVYAGYEDRVKAELAQRIKENSFSDLFGEVLVPSVKFKDDMGLLDAKDQRMFPGYVLIEAELNPETKRQVLSVPRVVKFLGGDDPVPLSVKEVERVMAGAKGEVVVKQEESDFILSGEVEIIDGAFAGFVGIVDKVDKAAERLRVMVSIFGRLTPVELSFNQVKR
jgi:transcription termination/antitermination protein NusG